jgi:hypothetical protein
MFRFLLYYSKNNENVTPMGKSGTGWELHPAKSYGGTKKKCGAKMKKKVGK